jgi:hypothetical protein
MRTLFALALVSAMLLLLAGCPQKPPSTSVVVPQPEPSTEQPQQAATEPCSQGNILQNDDCFLELAKAKNDVAICRRIYSIERLDSCLYQFSSDLGICKEITNASLRAGCLSKIAAKEKSEAICSLIENSEARLSCLKQVLPPCMLISEEKERNLCLALDKGDYTLCSSDSCFFAYAINKSDTDACVLIGVEADRFACQAVVAGDVSICKGASLSLKQDACIEEAAIILEDSGACDLATARGTYRNRCYNHFAVLYRNMDLCRLADPETARDDCYKNYSMEVGDTSSCPRIIETNNRRTCYYDSASANRMPSLCNPLSARLDRDNCYSRGMLLPDIGPVPLDCPNVNVTLWRDKCYYEAATHTSDASYCNNITPGKDQADCLFQLGVPA